MKANFFQLDVTDKESVSRFSNFVKENHGRLDILVNNAGIIEENHVNYDIL